MQIGFGAEGQPAFALEDGKEAGDGGHAQLGLQGWEEIASALDAFQGAADAELQPIGIGDFRAGAEGFEFGEQGEKRAKKMGVESIGWIYGNFHKKAKIFMLGKSRKSRGKEDFFGFIRVLPEFR